MRVRVDRTQFEEIAGLRALHRVEAACQIVRDSILPRGLADSYVVRVGDDPAGYGGVWNEHFPGRVMEFYLLPSYRQDATACFGEFLLATRATHVEAQTNMPQLHHMFREFAEAEVEEHILFEDGPTTTLTSPAGELRPRQPNEKGPEGPWVVAHDANVLGAGGILEHYNPPYADIYMAVAQPARRRGIGSYLVQELRRVCKDHDLIPAARCDPGNEASRRALVRGGLVECGRLVSGAVRPDSRA